MSQNLKSKKIGLTITVSEEPFSTDNRFNGNKLELTKVMRGSEHSVRSNPLTVEYIGYVSGGFKKKQDPNSQSLGEYDTPYEFSLLKIPACTKPGHTSFNDTMSNE